MLVKLDEPVTFLMTKTVTENKATKYCIVKYAEHCASIGKKIGINAFKALRFDPNKEYSTYNLTIRQKEISH